KRPVEDFAVSLLDLRQFGLTDHHLRRLVVEGKVKTGVEQHRVRAGHRQFRWSINFDPDFSLKTYFVLTVQGVAWARLLLGRAEAFLRQTDIPNSNDMIPVPCWMEDQCELWHLGNPILAYEKLAPNPFRLFAEFQKHGWPGLVENPFCPDDERLRNTVKK